MKTKLFVLSSLVVAAAFVGTLTLARGPMWPKGFEGQRQGSGFIKMEKRDDFWSGSEIKTQLTPFILNNDYTGFVTAASGTMMTKITPEHFAQLVKNGGFPAMTEKKAVQKIEKKMVKKPIKKSVKKMK